MMSRILLVDAYSQIFRLFYAIRQLTSASGEPANALYGIARLLLQLDTDFPSEYGAFVFDKGKCLRRTAIHPEYKAQRPPMPEELRCQTQRIHDWVEAFGWKTIEREGFEADDLLAGIAGERGEGTVRIITGDKDLGQLVKDGEVLLLRPGNAKKPWEEIGEKEVEEKFGVAPSQVCDYLSLLGDAVDNIPGIPGCGAKTAAKLLKEYGTIDNMLGHLEEMPAGKLRDTLASERTRLLKNRELVRLDTPLPEDWNGIQSITRRRPDWHRLLELCDKEGFKSIAAEIHKRSIPQQLTLGL